MINAERCFLSYRSHTFLNLTMQEICNTCTLGGIIAAQRYVTAGTSKPAKLCISGLKPMNVWIYVLSEIYGNFLSSSYLDLCIHYNRPDEQDSAAHSQVFARWISCFVYWVFFYFFFLITILFIPCPQYYTLLHLLPLGIFCFLCSESPSPSQIRVFVLQLVYSN